MQGKILFIGGFFPTSQIEYIRENTKRNLQVAADNYQKGLIQGLSEVFKGEIEFHNFMFLPTYPIGYKKVSIRKTNFVENDISGVNYGFINIPFLNKFSLEYHLKKIAYKIAKDSSERETVIFYSLQPHFLKTLRWLKKYKYKGKILFIVPDLPEFMAMSKTSFIHKCLKKNHLRIMEKESEKSDGFIVLTKEMMRKLPRNKPFEVLEGITKPFPKKLISSEKIDTLLNDIKQKKIILYAGNLSTKYGILELAETFLKVERDDYQLVICGDGELKETLTALSSEYKNFSFLGNLTTEEVRYLMVNSTLLINPRKNNEEYTKYSFPSKLIEYLASGTATISFKLDGVPSEYYKYSLVLNEDTDFKNQLEKIMSLELKELNELGEKAKKFIENEKNPSSQIIKILSLLEKLK